MKRISLFLLPLALVAVAFAQDAESPADLVKKLGHADYAVREAATKKLVELGDKARPELEKALKSEDLEVRLRAGRALRAIQAGPDKKDATKKAAPDRRDPLGPGGKVTSTSLSISKGKVNLKVTRLENGKRVTKEYEGTSIEDLKKRYPELKDVLGNFRVMTNRDPLKGLRFEKFWKDFNKDFNKDFDRDFWKKWQKDLAREAERLRQLSERWSKQWERRANDPRNRWFQVDRGTSLGATATRPSRVLNAQLGLRGRGIVIESVSPGSLGAKLGLERWDILLELNGGAIRSHAAVAAALRTYKAGEKLTAKIIRRAQAKTLETK